ncbi:glycosyltransferase [Streptomyces specialis]|uniref:glycosyltransferase n=1 Tax=Streptomyces specialis TaxID=498367 RepID=UPI00073E4E6F|nr:glycosyltransferase [Streptomyces specialis]
MRVAFFAQPEYSHLMPVVVPVADAARRAGHDAVVATGPHLVAAVERAGLRALNLPNAQSMATIWSDPEQIDQYGLDLSMLDKVAVETVASPPGALARNFAGRLALRFAQDLIEALEAWKPDLVVHETVAFAGYYAAEALGVPRAVLDISPMVTFEAESLLRELNDQRRALGLRPTDDPWHPYRTTVAGVVPEAFYPPERRTAGLRHYRPALVPAGQRLDPGVVELPDDRPLVLVSMGSFAPRVLARRPAVLEALVAAMGELPVTAVVALGEGRTAEDWPGRCPDNVHLTSFVQQQLLLPACDLFVTHGGFSGVREALHAGVPMVVLPLFAEQPQNGARVAELGLGATVPVEKADTAALVAACRRVLEDPGFRHRARAMQRRFLALPDFGRLAADLDALVPGPHTPF